MGTSVRRTTAKIKRILEEQESNDEKVVLPIVIGEVLRSKTTSEFIENCEVKIVISYGVSSLKGAKSYQEYVAGIGEDTVDPEKITSVEAEKIISAIISKIEEENGDIESSEILNAFKFAMSELLLNSSTNPVVFMKNFSIKFIQNIIMNQSYENLIVKFNEKNIDNEIRTYAKKFVNDNLLDNIHQYINGSITIDKLLEILSEKINII